MSKIAPPKEGTVKTELEERLKQEAQIQADVYVVEVDKTPTGKPRKTVKQMRPYASRLEAQNPDLLK